MSSLKGGDEVDDDILADSVRSVAFDGDGGQVNNEDSHVPIALTSEQLRMIEKNRLEAKQRKSLYLQKSVFQSGDESGKRSKITDYFGRSSRDVPLIPGDASGAMKNEVTEDFNSGTSQEGKMHIWRCDSNSTVSQSLNESTTIGEDELSMDCTSNVGIAQLFASEFDGCTDLKMAFSCRGNEGDLWGENSRSMKYEGVESRRMGWLWDGEVGVDAVNGECEQLSGARGCRTSRRGDFFGSSESKIKSQSTKSAIDEKKNDKDFLRFSRDKSGLRAGEEGYNPREIYIPPDAWKSFSAPRRQYWEYKQDHNDEIVFFQQGDFFCLFASDADIGAREFGLSYCKPYDSVGVNRKQIREWTAKFVLKGYKVTIIEQMNTAISDEEKELKKKKKQIEDRLVTEKFTPGTITDFEYIGNEHLSLYLMVILEHKSGDCDAPLYGCCFVDVSTYEWKILHFKDDCKNTQLETLLLNIRPKEVVYERLTLSTKTKRILDNSCIGCCFTPIDSFPPKDDARSLMLSYFPQLFTAKDTVNHDSNKFVSNKINLNRNCDLNTIIKVFDDEDESAVLACRAMGGLIGYLRTIKRSIINKGKREIISLDKDVVLRANYSFYGVYSGCNSRGLVLDANTLMNLEILENNDDYSVNGTLLSCYNVAVTSFGKRRIRKWVSHPLYEVSAIEKRQECVMFFLNNLDVLVSVRESFLPVKDLERLITRIQVGSVTLGLITDLLDSLESLCNSLSNLRCLMGQFDEWLLPAYLMDLLGSIPDVSSLFGLYSYDRQEARINDRFVPISGSNSEFDRLQEDMRVVNQKIESILEDLRREFNETKLSFCTGKMNRHLVFIPVNCKSKIPGFWRIVKEVKKGVQCAVPEIEENVAVLDRIKCNLEAIMFEFIVSFVCVFLEEYFDRCYRVVDVAAEVDALMGLAESSRNLMSKYDVCRPKFLNESKMVIRNMVHPFLVPMDGKALIPNDLDMGGTEPSTILITGPNMGGKSTFLRQVCILVIMSQMGSYVPASRFELRPFDRIFTRTGAHDSIMSGKSTFLVELEETSKILNECTNESLIIIDELGRGTSTFDGYAIAYATLKYLQKFEAKILFSTHYHNLTREFYGEAVRQAHMLCKKCGDKEMTFLYKLVPGPSTSSYGLEVASMTNIPAEVLDRAGQVSKNFELITRYKRRNSSRHPKVNIFLELMRLSRAFSSAQEISELHKFAKIIFRRDNGHRSITSHEN